LRSNSKISSSLVFLVAFGCAGSSVEGTSTGSPPGNGGPALVFTPNPDPAITDNDAGAWFGAALVTSLLDEPLHPGITFKFVPYAMPCIITDAGYSADRTSMVLGVTCPFGYPGAGYNIFSFSSNQAGTKITVQGILVDGGQACEPLDGTCVGDADCCIGLSCQPDGGPKRSCGYSWPN
jgi:hypothetical protein